VSRREDIDNGIWSDPEFAALPQRAKTLYIWSFTNSRCGMSGLYKLPAGTAAFEIGLTREEEAAAFAELERAGFVFYEAGVVFVRTRVKHLRTRGENMAKSIVSDVAKVAPEHPLRRRFLEKYAAEGWKGLRESLEQLSHKQAIPENPSGGSSGVPGQGQGQGQGNGRGQRQVGETEPVGGLRQKERRTYGVPCVIEAEEEA